MLIALFILLSFVGRSLRTPAAIVGGIGFGFFIDELGKFITSDNDYFFKPTAALIYVVFILLFLATRATRRRRGFTPREYLVNAMDLATEAARHDFDVREKTRALSMIDRCDPGDPLAEPLREMLRRVDALPAREPRRVTRWALGIRAWYFRLVARPRFHAAIGWLFAVWALVSATAIVAILPDRQLSFVNLCSMGSQAVAIVLVAIGVAQLAKHDRLDAYRWFERALLVQIFITQVFAFVSSQFSAVFGLGVAVLLLITIRYMIRGERHLERAAEVAKQPPEPVAV
jgi:hypothetical protein